MGKALRETITYTPSFNWGAVSDTGKVRHENQDIYLVDTKMGLFLVSDGVGGHPCWALASKIVARDMPFLIDSKLKQLRTCGINAIKSVLTKAIIALSRNMRAESLSVLGFTGMGATLVVVLVRENRAFVANVGDSRAYLFRKGKLSQLSEDHSVIGILLRAGDITPREERYHPARGQLSQYIGMLEEANPFLCMVALKENDRLLLCSDGLTGLVSEDEIVSILQDHADPNDACKELVETANFYGGPDNVTALIVDWRYTGPAKK